MHYAETPRPIVMLSPMAGYTTSAFRSLVKEIAPETLVCTELVSTEGLRHRGKTTMELTRFRPNEQPLLLQLFGNKPASFTEAAAYAEEAGFAGIDLNMGCPAKKVVSSEHGSALIQKPELAYAIVEALSKATTLPVSVKTRLGYADSAELLTFTKGLENAGTKLLIIHGRTVQQRHSGAADWDPIYEVQKQLSIPVVGNGGVENYRDGLAKQKNLAGFTMGRSALGNPWVFLQDPPEVTTELKLRTMLRHIALLCEDTGGDWGVTEFRKWLPWYLAGMPEGKQLQHALLEVTTLKEFQNTVALTSDVADSRSR